MTAALDASTIASTAYACDNADCPDFSIIRLVTLPEIAPGLLMVPPVICARCGYHVPVVDLARCGPT